MDFMNLFLAQQRFALALCHFSCVLKDYIAISILNPQGCVA